MLSHQRVFRQPLFTRIKTWLGGAGPVIQCCFDRKIPAMPLNELNLQLKQYREI